MELPSGFVTMMQDLLGQEAEAFFAAMKSAPSVSVRLNGRKPSDAFEGCRGVKWCEKGRYLDSRPVFTLDPLLHAGAYYVQDASSMIHYECIKRILRALNDKTPIDSAEKGNEIIHPVTILDLCAAPGGKTTAMIDAIPDGSRVTANEYIGKRATILRENLTKWGYPDVNVTNRDSKWFAENGDCFYIVAVDAPCSGEGMMRKDPDAVAQWSHELISQCATLQREILTNAVHALKPGGFLIYSTCTFNRMENEENAEFIRDVLGLIPFDPHFPEEWGIPHGIDTSLPVYRFMPHKTEGEGLFLAIFRKPGEYKPSIISPRVKPLASPLRKRVRTDHKIVSHKGPKDTRRGNGKDSKNNDIANVPEIEDILSVTFDRTSYPMAALDHEQALAYLRRESVVLPPEIPKGIVIVTYKGLSLGAVKNIGTRANNLYPKNWRILMR